MSKRPPPGATSGRKSARAALKGGKGWDEATLEQRRRVRLQRLERENYTAIPEFDNLTITVDSATQGQKRPGRPRSAFSAPKQNSSAIVIGTGDEGLKRANRKETRLLVARKKTLADIIDEETQQASALRARNGSVDTDVPAEMLNVYYYMTCVATSVQGQSPSPPVRHFCSICGYKGLYTCVDCGMRYCSLACKSAHADTRCLKHVV
ncbi:Zinc finger HIT domain-containing protein 1 [Coemansia sp. RSA 2399]|nr:Zinc finger HIT domain-containing protein 1 [Coemansia sp. RSA 2399]KAJ1907087.1 Zinc finger HIT domain-containing protein 1 [Coemansia sp. IMI 209127]